MSLQEKIIHFFKGGQELFSDDSMHLFNYRRIWKMAVMITGSVALIPLIFITIVDYQVTQNAMESEFLLRTTRSVSNNRRTISFFLTERQSALAFIVHDNKFYELNDPQRLALILENLKKSFGGGFVDLGLIDFLGRQWNYVGPYSLAGKDYSHQEWYKQVMEQGGHISDVFLGYRKVPHIVIAARGDVQGGLFYILRAAINIAPFEDLLSNLELGGMGDAFLINHQGILQTSSRYYGEVLDKIPLPVPAYSPRTEVMEGKDPKGRDLFIGYRFIDNTPFILMIVKDKRELMESWLGTRLALIIFLAGSITVILSVILAMATYMVRKMKITDEERVSTLHQVEYASKMASIGRLAANVAHEINNPLAIINEKAGLIKDLFEFTKKYAGDPKLGNLVEGILRSVKRAGTITKRLLTFARNLEAEVEPIDMRGIIEETIGYLDKEAEFRGIKVELDISDDIPIFESDPGKNPADIS